MIVFSNNAFCGLSAPLLIGGNQLLVDPTRAELFPSPTAPDYFYVTLESTDFTQREIVKVTRRVGNLLTVSERGCDGTVERDWYVGQTIVDHRVTAGTLSTFLQGARRQGVLISSAQTALIDVVPWDGQANKALKWLVTINCPSESKTCSFELLALTGGALLTPTWTRVGFLGHSVNILINITNGIDKVNLFITNHESSEISLDLVRITT